MSSYFNRSSASPEDPLTGVLTTPRLRNELALLVAVCSDTMRRSLEATFELPQGLGDSPGISTDDSAADLLVGLDDKEDKTPVRGSSVGAGDPRTQRLDVVSTQTQHLKRTALLFFDKWQIDVLRRLGQVLSVRPDDIRQARREAKRKASDAHRSQKRQRYYAWAAGLDNAPPEKLPVSEYGSEDDELLRSLDLGVVRLPEDKRIILVDSLLLLLLSLERYVAQSRLLMVCLTRAFGLPSSVLRDHESKVAKGLLKTAASNACAAAESTARQAQDDAASRRWKVGLATVAGAALIGVTGGLAAPILAAGVGSIMGGLGLGAVATLLGPLATNMVLVGGLFGAYGGRMTGQAVEKYAREVRDFSFVPLRPLSSSSPSAEASRGSDSATLANEENQDVLKLRVVIGISGSLLYDTEVVQPWRVIDVADVEAFALKWEVDALIALGRSLDTVLQNYAWDFAKFQILSALIAGLWPFGLLKAATALDNPFSVAKNRSDKAGKVLADALINKAQGERPVTLIGYSLGARVVYSCLLELARRGAFGLVESAILMGAPVPSDPAEWRRIRAIVGGRVVNLYSKDDFMLAFLYRASSVQLGVAGLQNISGINGIENVDVTDTIGKHSDYANRTGLILERIGFEEIATGQLQQQKELLCALPTVARDEMATHAHNSTQDNQFAKEENGQIVLVDEEKPCVSSSRAMECSDLEPWQSATREGELATNLSRTRITEHASSVMSGRSFPERHVTALEEDDDDDGISEHGPIELTSVDPEPEEDDAADAPNGHERG